LSQLQVVLPEGRLPESTLRFSVIGTDRSDNCKQVMPK